MIRDHDLIEELLAVRALGGLDGDDVDVLARERADHGDCDECRRLEDGFEETAGRLAFALEPVEVDASIVDRILATPAAPAAPRTPESTTDERVVDLGEAREHPSRRWRALVAVAAAVVLIVMSAVWLSSNRTTQVTAASPTQRFLTFSGNAQGEVRLAYTPGRAGGVMWGSGLDDPGPDQAYEVWAITGDQVVSQGCVSPTDGSIGLQVGADVGAADVMAVTAESSGCPSAPTTEPIWVAPVS
jgi:anti-sigma-K factor RskA